MYGPEIKPKKTRWGAMGKPGLSPWAKGTTAEDLRAQQTTAEDQDQAAKPVHPPEQSTKQIK